MLLQRIGIQGALVRNSRLAKALRDFYKLNNGTPFTKATVLYDSDRMEAGREDLVLNKSVARRQNVCVVSVSQDNTAYGFFVKAPLADGGLAVRCSDAFLFVAKSPSSLESSLDPFKVSYAFPHAEVTLRERSIIYVEERHLLGGFRLRIVPPGVPLVSESHKGGLCARVGPVHVRPPSCGRILTQLSLLSSFASPCVSQKEKPNKKWPRRSLKWKKRGGRLHFRNFCGA